MKIAKMAKENTKEHIIRQTGIKYKGGEVRLVHAANQANTTVWTMIDYVDKENLQPTKQSFEELEKDLEEIQTCCDDFFTCF